MRPFEKRPFRKVRFSANICRLAPYAYPTVWKRVFPGPTHYNRNGLFRTEGMSKAIAGLRAFFPQMAIGAGAGLRLYTLAEGAPGSTAIQVFLGMQKWQGVHIFHEK